MSQDSGIELVSRGALHAQRTAIVDADGAHSYAELLAASARIASGLLAGATDLAGARVCYLIGPSFAHVATQWGVFRAGGVAVPFCTSHPVPELEHVIDDARPCALVASSEYAALLQPLAASRGLRYVAVAELQQTDPVQLPAVEASRHAMLIYTSGTTGKPKGAITTHAILSAQMQSLVTAWELQPSDRILHVLPLHHLHGILNALLSPLFAGGCVELQPRFDAQTVLERFLAAPELTLFMAVPTI
jgi:malonyl-CoA/methylmalonyl-CoA synthetase